MEERGSKSKSISKSKSSSGSSTLSPLAPPFTLNRQNPSLLDPSIGPPHAYNASSSGGVSFGHYNGGSYNPEGVLGLSGLAEAGWCSSQTNPFRGFGVLDDFCAPIDSVVVSTEAHFAQGTVNGYGKSPEQRGHFWREKESNGCGFSFPEKGFATAEALKTLGGNSSLRRNCTVIPGKEDAISSGGSTKVTTDSFPFPPGNSNVSPTYISAESVEVFEKVSQLQKQYSGPVINSLKHCDPSSLAPNPLISKNGNCGGRFADSNNNSIPSRHKEIDVLLNADDSFSGELNELKDCTSAESCSAYNYESSSSKSVACDSVVLSCKEKSDMRITHSKLADDIVLEHRDGKTSFPVKISSEMYDKSDSEVDSPCWKGTLAFRNSPFNDSRTQNSQLLKNDLEKGRSGLNPLAPQFYPRSARGIPDSYENKSFREDLSSSSMDSAVFNLSSRKVQISDAVDAGLCAPKANSKVEPKICSDIHWTMTETALLKQLSSPEKFSHLAQQSLVGEYLISEEKAVVGDTVGSFVKDPRDVAQNDLPCVPSLVTGHVSPGNRISSELTETLPGASNSLSTTPPKLDAQMIVNALHNLSEILAHNCSNDVYSLMEHENNTLQHVINNLYVCVKKSVGRRTPMPESSPRTFYWPRKSTNLLKGTNMEKFRVTREVGCAPTSIQSEYKLEAK